jgi:hypothetical protein
LVITGTGYAKVETSLFDYVESAAIDQPYEFTTTMVITTVNDGMHLTNGSLGFSNCSLCNNVNFTTNVNGTNMSTTATFTAPAANLAGSYTVASWAASSFDVKYDWNPVGLYVIRSGPQYDLPTWRCTSNGYVNPTSSGNGTTYTGLDGCVFPWAAGLMTFPAMTAGTPNHPVPLSMTEINSHMSQAQQSGLPGALGSGTYLHYLADKTMADANRTKACPTDGSLPPAPTDYNCDEYPFRTTYEGAAQTSGGPRSFPGCQMLDPPVNSSDGFSRCYVPSRQNSAQGNIIINAIRSDQLLDQDPYQVKILTS